MSNPKPFVKVGDRIPDYLYFGVLNKGEDQPHKVKVGETFKGKKVVLFGIPGAFTSICSSKHLPQYVDKSKELKAKGVDIIACTAVNDPYVLREWAEAHKVKDDVIMLADGDAVFHSALGLVQELPFAGERGLRFSMLIDDCVIRVLNVEEQGALQYVVSGPDHMLKDLENLGKQ